MIGGITMDFDEIVKSRRSIRKYIGKDVPDELTVRLLEAACQAPNAGNCQPWHFYAVKDISVRQKLCEKAYPSEWLMQAPVIIVVCIDPTVTRQRYGNRGETLYCIQDTAAAIQNILLCAKSNGLGSCWIGAFNESACREVLDLPEEMRPVAMIPVGYAAVEPPARPRKPLSETATFI
jgi:nitroreductase